jgi:trehalose 6-phosphate phosphatase
MMGAMPLSSREALIKDPSGTLLALDFDGTLAHIVDDPARALVHPRSFAALSRLGRVLGQVAIVTGRPVRQALQLGGFEGAPGLERLVIHGQYGAEVWSADGSAPLLPSRPDNVERLVKVLPEWLLDAGMSHVHVEDKGLAVAIHTRSAGPDAFQALLEPLGRLAADFGLTVEPGRQVIELRGSGIDKGMAVRALVESSGARNVVFAGDDLGDVAAFEVVRALREQGINGLLVCSQSPEQDALVTLADVVVPGPDGIADWLEALADEF